MAIVYNIRLTQSTGATEGIISTSKLIRGDHGEVMAFTDRVATHDYAAKHNRKYGDLGARYSVEEAGK